MEKAHADSACSRDAEQWYIAAMLPRREFLKNAGALAAAQTALRAADANTIVVDPQPRFDISPWLYMQFMEPLGVTDSCVEAAWDYDRDDWRKDFVDTVKDLAPGAMRFGGLYSRLLQMARRHRPRAPGVLGCATTSGAARRPIAPAPTSSSTSAAASAPSRSTASTS